MTPQERQLVDDLFARLSQVDNAPQDGEALAAIAEGQRRAPNALYTLVQTVLLQDEALKRANDRIQELERGPDPQQAPAGGFLDSMRDAVFGQSRGSVPSVRPGQSSQRPAWNTGQVLSPGQPQNGQQAGGFGQTQPEPQGRPGGAGGSFLGTAAAAAAGVVGGSLLLGSIRSMMGGSGSGADKQALGDTASTSGNDTGSPWSSGSSNSDLAKDAGLNDVASAGDRNNESAGQGLSDQGSYDHASYEDDADDYGDDFDDDSDYA